ncbi:circadian clock-controlled protein-like [Zootermopsis nevadensis]|uniref:Circadian clock-controlled protein n=1 Tax=Zootermopsis nevadensis TaxID=136037 RepID=A0A067R736_ZOONE|nr:circadian clock-controlled protein-like [Zootermopsis nevadensis]KDR14111.1 Circadian clock-controlled protein [Zootermopsis nevadensis]
METTVFLAVSCLLFNFAEQSRIPSYIKVCKRSDPKLNDCIINSIETLRPYLLKGIPDLDVPSIEPLTLPEILVAQGAGIKAVGKNIDIYGPGSFVIRKLNVDLENYQVDISVDLPYLTFDGAYEVSGRLLVLPLKGKGPVKANATDCKGDVVLYAQLMKKADGSYLQFNNIDMKITIGGYHVRLDNLFNGDKFLGEATNAALNENPKELIAYLKPIVEKTVKDIIQKIANKITQHFTVQELLPDD